MSKCPPKPLLCLDESEDDWRRRIWMICFDTYVPRPVRRMGPKPDEVPAHIRIGDDLLWGGSGPWDFPKCTRRPWDMPESIAAEASK